MEKGETQDFLKIILWKKGETQDSFFCLSMLFEIRPLASTSSMELKQIQEIIMPHDKVIKPLKSNIFIK